MAKFEFRGRVLKVIPKVIGMGLLSLVLALLLPTPIFLVVMASWWGVRKATAK